MHSSNQDQAEFWGTSAAGAKWLTFEDRLDAALRPVLDLVLARAALKPGMRVLDIGCGTGASVLAAAERVGPTGHVTGVDISPPFLERAHQRVQAAGIDHVTLLQADAQTHCFGAARFDAIMSRFGVMFFADPSAAFANMGQALAPDGAMSFAAWGPLDGNPWFRDPYIAAVERLGRPPKRDRNAPGPLAFHDKDRVLGLFSKAGLAARAEAVLLHLTPQGGVDGAAALCTKVGAASRVITHFEGTEADEQAIQMAVAKTFQAYDTDDGLRLPALINVFHATHRS